MGIEYEHTESSEVDPYANEWCHQAFASITGKGGLGHEFTSVDQQIHYRPASDRRLSMRSDMYVAGASCQPWSAMKWCGGDTAKTGSPEDHPWYRHMTEDVPLWIQDNRPRGGILEQVWRKFATTPLEGSADDETECHRLLSRLETMGYYTRALRLDHGTWASGGKIRSYCEMLFVDVLGLFLLQFHGASLFVVFRKFVFVRCYICFMDDELGGQEAVEAWEKTVRMIFDDRSRRLPALLLPKPAEASDEAEARISRGSVLSVMDIVAAKREWKRYLMKAHLIIIVVVTTT